MSTYVIQRFDNLGLRATFTAAISSGDWVNVFGTSEQSRNRQGVVIFNPSTSDDIQIILAKPSDVEGDVDGYIANIVVPQGEEKFIPCNGSINIWALSIGAAVSNCSALELL